MNKNIQTHPHFELIVGTMFAGKSTELIKRSKRYQISGLEVEIFKPTTDDRYEVDKVESHDGLKIEVENVSEANDILNRLDDNKDVVAIDEVQFFDSEIVEICDNLAHSGKIVVAADLLKDFRDQPFPFSDEKKNMMDLVQHADDFRHLKAICTYQENNEPCGREATRVQRFVDGEIAPLDSPTVEVGGTESYAPRCREHFVFYQ
jgi:thymidine kinase